VPLLALLVVAALEIWVIIQVAGAIGAGYTVLLLLATSLAGGWLLRHEGGRAWRSFIQAVNAGRPPHREVTDGALILVGGALMVVPGFVTGALGLLCLLPPARIVLRRLLLAAAARRMVPRVIRVRSSRAPDPDPHRVIEGEIDR
jgi:UPF0716 protein FxsA